MVCSLAACAPAAINRPPIVRYPTTTPPDQRPPVQTPSTRPKPVPREPVYLNNPRNGASVRVAVGETLNIKLDSPSDAIYRWLVEQDWEKRILVLHRDEYAYDRRKGAAPNAGAQLFQFAVKEPGRSEIRFYYASDRHSKKVRTVTLYVEAVQ